ncbi:diguanylate phosphodiesterase (plasmid) [Pseudoalteromonas sp. Bsw20308]|uniref:EAL domain-containing protein n=1 Tax=Pseudoalteromonas sp. Bsw20308 TaxID=283699 RepID=UPI0002AAD2B5|nr:EAL domain-containing protein [Pseudoalteromonas sp. Bsw20308]ALQ10092.1 diguanylate phosphodiesterase [Pseudoalteromonas sp. Bsw20308]
MYWSKFFFLTITVCFLCIGSVSASQNYAQQLQRISTDEGLSQSYALQSIQDDIGYIWIATAQGLNRYDGYQIKTFDGGFDLDQDYINKLFKTQDGQIIVSTDVSGAYMINPLTLKTEKIYSGQLDKKQTDFSPISSITQLENTFYFAINEKIFSFNNDQKKLDLKIALKNKNYYIRALKIYDNTLYIGTDNGLFTYNLKTQSLAPLTIHQPKKTTVDNNDIKFLTIDDDLGLLIGTVEGMYRIAFNTTKQIDPTQITTLIADYNIWDYANTVYGEFIATESGLFQYHRDTTQLEFILSFDKSKFNITENTINNLMLDRSGVLWLASRTQGVLTWATQTRRFKQITLPKNNTINKIYQDKNHILWLGTNDGLTRYNLTTKDSKTYLQSTDSKAVYGEYSVYDIFPSQLDDKYLWLVRFNGLDLFDKSTGKIIEKRNQKKSGVNGENLYGFTPFSSDVFTYMSSENFYIYNGKTGESRVINGLKDKVNPLKAYTFHQPLKSHPKELLLSTAKRLYRYNEKTQKLTTIFQSNSTKDNVFHTVENIYLDEARDTLWLATTQEGLIGVNPSTYQRKHYIGLKNTLRTDSIYSLLADDHNGFLWVSSNNGLYQLNLDTLNTNTYTIEDGLSTNEFEPISAVRLQDNQLAFGSNSGLQVFDPSDFITTSSKSSLAITDIGLFSKSLSYYPNEYTNKPLMLSHKDMGLMISFSIFDYQNKDKVRYKVTLSGPTLLTYDDLKVNKVFFTKLQPGDYSLTVSAYTRDGVNISIPKTLNFNVAYAPWQSPIAYTAYLFGIIIILSLLFWQYRSRQIVIGKAHRATIDSQKQTELALKNNKSGVWNYYFKDNSVNTQRGKELGYLDLPKRVQLDDFLALIHPDDRRRIESQLLSYAQQNDTVSLQNNWQATYRLRHKTGHWLWYQDLGQIVYKPQSSEPLYISGIYTNITEQRANEQQAAILGQVFSQITDWLLILDDQLMPFSANNSFINTFSNKKSIAELNPKLFIKAIGKAKCKEYSAILKALKPTQNWRTDAYINTAINNEHPIHISVTAVAKDTNDVSYYVVVISDLTEQKNAENELRYLANFDPLTRLPNRSLMHQKIEKAINHADKSNKQCALLFIDLDKFKPVNDSFGHAVGDKLLCNITQRVTNILSNKAILGRQSGDEFLVLIKHVDSLKSLTETVKEISRELASKVIIEDFSINISASIGVALYPFDAINADLLIRNADVAMMHAKQAGRNGFKFFSEEMNEEIKQKLILENDLKDAVKDNRFFNHYQPIVDIKTKTINGVELLMRWDNKGQLVSPAVFIPIAEETGLIEKLTEQAMKRALIELAPILSNNPLFYISLNLSPKHILKANITDRLLYILAKSQISPRQIRLEITESILLEDKFKAAKQLQNLKAAGFKLLLDDFGTGYSSLTYLSQFPIDVIKIDQSFVNSIGIDKDDESIIKTIYSLAENLELYCIAEGVETREQMIFLANIGCHVLQGYYFAKPMSAKELRKNSCFEEILGLI